MKLSVICPIYNEEKYIVPFLDSVLQQDFSHDDMEVLLVDGMSRDRTRQVISQYIAKYPFLRLLDNPERTAPCAMNVGIKEAKGEVIIRLDAHALYPFNYFSTLVTRLYQLNADNIGCVLNTDVLNKTPKTLAIREVLSNRFGVGNSSFRTGVTSACEVDTVPFGCWRREVFQKYGFYDKRLVRNQDIELNKRIKRGGGHIFIIPDISCTYLARETFKALAKNNYGNGKWNILTVYYTKYFSSLSVRHFIPLAFVLSLLLPIVLMPLNLWFGVLSLMSLGAYMVTLGGVSFTIWKTKRLNVFYLLMSFLTLHLSYGWGSLMGIFKVVGLKIQGK